MKYSIATKSKKLYKIILIFLLLHAQPVSAQLVDMKEVVKILKEVLNKRIDSLSKYDYTQHVIYLHPDGVTADVISSIKTTSFTRLTNYFRLPLPEIKYVFPAPDSITFYAPDSMIRYHFPPGGYTFIETDDLLPHLTIKGDTFIYKTSEKKFLNGHYGFMNGDKGFEQFSYAWFIPENFELISYKSNRKGKWRREGNMIHFVAEPQQNDLLFEIVYKRSQKVPDDINGRKINYTKSFAISSPNITIKANDPQRADGDIISLNLNGEWILKGYEVSELPLTLKASTSRNQNYLILYAENMGAIPPNTAAIEIFDGTTSQKIILNSATGYCEAILLNLK